MKKEVIRFLLFVFIITLFLGVCFTSADFFTLKSASNLNGNLNCSKELEHYAS